MAKKREPLQADTFWPAVVRAFASTVVALIERLGWPGAVVVIGFLFVERNASDAQKEELISRLLLPTDIPEALSWTIPTAIGLMLLYVQHYLWKRREAALQQEIDRLSEWKSAVQQGNIPTRLHYTSETSNASSNRGPKASGKRRRGGGK